MNYKKDNRIDTLFRSFRTKEENNIHTKGYTVTAPTTRRMRFRMILLAFLFIIPSYSSVPDTRKDNHVNTAVITNSTKDNADA